MEPKLVIVNQQQLTTQPMKVVVGSAQSFRNVLAPADYWLRPLMVNAWTQTMDNDFSYINYIEQREQQSKREVELEEKVKMLEENLKAHADLLSQIHATSAKTTALLGQQHRYQSQHNEQGSTANVNNINCITNRTPQTNTGTVSTVNSGHNSPINSVINPLQQVNCSPADSVKYTIIAEGSGNQSGEPIEIQLAEDDGAINLNSSSDSGRLEICYASEENVEIKSELNVDNKRTLEQPSTYTQNVYPHIKKRKIDVNQTETLSNNSSHSFCSDQGMISPANVEQKQSRRSSNSSLKNPKMERSNSSKKTTQNASPKMSLMDTDNIMVSIGPNNTRIPASVYESINWSSASIATRKLLMILFDREVLATHSMTGKPSPAFKDQGKPPKQMLNPLIVQDIIFAVTRKCKVSEKEVRNAITTKCADENKMMKLQLSKRTPMHEINGENGVAPKKNINKGNVAPINSINKENVISHDVIRN